MNPIPHPESVVIGPTLVVTWGMIALALLIIIVFGLLSVWFITWAIKNAVATQVDTHVRAVQEQVNRVVSVAESANGQYEGLRKRVDEAQITATEALAGVRKLEGAVQTLQRRVGLPNV